MPIWRAGPAPFTLRDFPTRFPDVRSLGMTNVDLTLAKEWSVRERVKLQFRGEFFNAINHVNPKQ